MARAWDPCPTTPCSSTARRDRGGSSSSVSLSLSQLPDSKTTKGNTQVSRGDGGDSSDSSHVSEESDLDEREAGTMARFVPTLVLERLRAAGESAMAKKMAGPGSGAEAGSESAGGERAAVQLPQVIKQQTPVTGHLTSFTSTQHSQLWVASISTTLLAAQLRRSDEQGILSSTVLTVLSVGTVCMVLFHYCLVEVHARLMSSQGPYCLY